MGRPRKSTNKPEELAIYRVVTDKERRINVCVELAHGSINAVHSTNVGGIDVDVYEIDWDIAARSKDYVVHMIDIMEDLEEDFFVDIVLRLRKALSSFSFLEKIQ